MRGRTDPCQERCDERPECDLLSCIATCACPVDCDEPDRWENCRLRTVSMPVAITTHHPTIHQHVRPIPHTPVLDPHDVGARPIPQGITERP